MSSRVLAAKHEDLVRPFAWRTVAAGSEAPADSDAVGTSMSDPRAAKREPSIEDRLRLAQEAGYREGEAAAQSRAEQEIRIAVGRLAESIAAIQEYRVRLHRQAEVDTVRLAIAIARRVLRRELTVDPSAIEGLVGVALQRLQTQENCRVRMNPAYVPALRATIERLGMETRVEVLADPAQEPGAAVFEMARGNLDASIEMQLKEIERGLADRFPQPR